MKPWGLVTVGAAVEICSCGTAGWVYYNTGLTKGPDGYVLLMEASHPKEIVGEPFTHFFAASKDLKNWEIGRAHV